jgi:hypothetical protein
MLLDCCWRHQEGREGVDWQKTGVVSALRRRCAIRLPKSQNVLLPTERIAPWKFCFTASA